MEEARIVAIVGGIGSGKSVVSRVLKLMGYPVYDCDSKARWLMDSDEAMKTRLSGAFGPLVVVGGKIDRAALSKIVFRDSLKLRQLNSIVHPAVIADFQKWKSNRRERQLFFETAILKESGMDTVADEVWEVVAPIDLRIRRVMERNNLTETSVKERINSQSGIADVGKPLFRIQNDGKESLLSQVSKLVKHDNSTGVGL